MQKDSTEIKISISVKIKIFILRICVCAHLAQILCMKYIIFRTMQKMCAEMRFKMALSNIFGWHKKEEQKAGTACGTACGASDKPDEKPAA